MRNFVTGKSYNYVQLTKYSTDYHQCVWNGVNVQRVPDVERRQPQTSELTKS